MNNTSCYFCGEPSQLEQHHIVPRRFDGSDDDENLVRVCPTCHEKLESLYDKRFYDALGVEKPDSGDGEFVGFCAHGDCHAEADHRVTGAKTFTFCDTHFTCDYTTCDNKPVKTIPTPDEGTAGCVCEEHGRCDYKECQRKEVGVYRIEPQFGPDKTAIRCRFHPLDETTLYTIENANRPGWGE